ATSVMALKGPGVPGKGRPRSRARGLVMSGTLGVGDGIGVQPAPAEMPGRNIEGKGAFGGAAREGMRTAGPKLAARRPVQKAWRFAQDRRLGPAFVRIRVRLCGDQPRRIGM